MLQIEVVVHDGGASVDDDGGACDNGGSIADFLSLNCDPSLTKKIFERLLFSLYALFSFHNITVEIYHPNVTYPKKVDIRMKTAVAVRIPEMQ